MRCFQRLLSILNQRFQRVQTETNKFLNKEMQHRGHTVKTSNYRLKDIVHFGSVMLLKVWIVFNSIISIILAGMLACLDCAGP